MSNKHGEILEGLKMSRVEEATVGDTIKKELSQRYKDISNTLVDAVYMLLLNMTDEEWDKIVAEFPKDQSNLASINQWLKRPTIKDYDRFAYDMLHDFNNNKSGLMKLVELISNTSSGKKIFNVTDSSNDLS